MKNNKLGDRMKMYESKGTSEKLIPLLPVVIRLDGISFSKFTKGLKRPYDERLSRLMIETAKILLKEVNANVAYTQSDEITLIFYNNDIKSQMLYNGKLSKLNSTLSGLASAYFNKKLPEYIPEKSELIPIFDCRTFNVPTLDEAVNSVLWRELDATKNSISMAASEYYSSKFLEYKNGSDKQELLFQKGINWNDYPDFFKRGTYIQRKRVIRKFTEMELVKLPPKHKARLDPNTEIERWDIREVSLPPLLKINNKIDVIIFGKDPIKDNSKSF